MAATVEILERTKTVGRFLVIADITTDSSYPTGGEAISPRQLGLSTIDFLLPSSAGGYFFEYDHTNKKLKAFRFDYSATAIGPAVEVANAVDLSAVKVRVLAVGY